MLHAGNTAVPRQILVYSSRGSNNVLELPFQTTLIDTKETARPPETDITKADGLRLFRVEHGQIGRAHVWTPVTHAQLVCRLLLEQQKDKKADINSNERKRE